MNILNLNINEHMPDIIDSIIEVYGKRNKAQIIEQQKRYFYTSYAEPDSVLNYHSFLENCLVNETEIKYLRRIGVLDSSFELRKSYQKFPKKIKKLSRKYLDTGFIEATSDFEIQNNYGICSFRDDNQDSVNKIKKHIKTLNQISYLNGLRDEKEPLITEDNYEEFKQTEEFKKLYEQIKKYFKIYEELSIELNNQLKKISYLKNYYDEESEKHRKLYKLKILNLYDEIKPLIPEKTRKALNENFKNLEEKVDFLLNFDPFDEALIDNFSSEYEEDLHNSEVPENKKRGILIGRTSYLEKLGIGVKFWDYKIYDEIIKREEVKSCIPSQDFVDYILKKKAKCKESTRQTCTYQNVLFKKCVEDIIAPSINNCTDLKTPRTEAKECLYDLIKKGNSCNFITEIDKDGKISLHPVIFHMVTRSDCAVIDYIFLHELIHALEFHDEFPDWKTGFDVGDKNLVNKYNKKYRKYERMNETMTDIIVEKVRKILLKKGIYIADSKKLTDTKIVKNRNSDIILKRMLYPLFDRVGNELLDARITGDTLSFVTLIGLKNFQDLNDAINHVDNLLDTKRLKEKLKRKDHQDPTVIEYREIMNQINLIYQDIDRKLENIHHGKPKVYHK